MANTCTKRCSASLIIREMKSKPQTTSHLPEGLGPQSQKSGGGEKGTLVPWRCYRSLVPPVWEAVRRVLQRLDTELP